MTALLAGETRQFVTHVVVNPVVESVKERAERLGRMASYCFGYGLMVGLAIITNNQPDPVFPWATPEEVDPQTGESKWGFDFIEDDETKEQVSQHPRFLDEDDLAPFAAGRFADDFAI